MNVAVPPRPLRLQSNKLILEELPNELMIYDPDRKKAFCLNGTAASVWRHADGKTTVAEIAMKIGKEGFPASEEVVLFALEVLSKDGLLAGPAEVAPGMTRRALLQRMGVGAAGAVPLVTVLFVNPAKAHASTSGPAEPPPGHPRNFGHGSGKGGFWDWLESFF